MQISLSFKRIFLAPGKTFALPTVAGSRVRVVDGMVWATTSNNPDDVWLGPGDEHVVQSPGLTVVESVARSTIELLPPAAIGPDTGSNGTGGHIMNRYQIRIPRAACHFAAIAMTAITIGLLVVLPAKIGSVRHDALPHATSNVLAATPDRRTVTQAGGTVTPLEGRITQASSGVTPPTRVQ
jgi:Protein of unknown function (DUF2917)